jgi:hypothetical protein
LPSSNQPDRERTTAYRDSSGPISRSDAYCATIVGDWQEPSGESRFLATDGWKIEGKKGIVGHGGCGKSVVRVEGRLDNEFLHDFNELRYTRQPKIRPSVNNAG